MRHLRSWTLVLFFCAALAAFIGAPAGASAATTCPTATNQSGKNLNGSNFNGCNFAGFNFAGANLNKSTFVGANVAGANFAGANLNQADFTSANESHAVFNGANMNAAALDHGDASYANFTGANTNKATCVGTNVLGIIGKLSCTGSITATVPGAPTGVTATGTATSALVAFTSPVNGGSPITGYVVASSPGGITASGSGSPITVAGLGDGKTYTFTVIASNAIGSGSASSPSNPVTIDVTPPAVTVPASRTLEATGPAGAQFTFSATATDAVDGTDAVFCFPAPLLYPLGPTTVKCSATDAHGNTGSASFTVTVRDTTPPVVTVPANQTLEATGPTGASTTYSASAADLVDGTVATSCAPPSGSTFALGQTTVTCSATDGHGNTGLASFTETVRDTTAPALSVPADKTVEATGSHGAAVSFSASASDLFDGAVTPTCSPASGSTFSLGTTSVGCTATDAHGNATAGSFKVTVVDTTAPVLTLPADRTAEATGPGGAVVSFSATATDLVDGATGVSCSPSSGSTFPLGQTAVSCSSTDAAGNTATRSFNVSVVDTTPPIVTVPADESVEGVGAHGATVAFSSSAVDLVDGNVPTLCSPSSGANFPFGQTTVTCTAVDTHANAASASFAVTVKDTTPPSLTLPADQSAEATGTDGASVSFSATATDLVDGAVTPICSTPSGSTFPLGTTTVTCAASDAAGNVASGSFNVAVVDTTPPTLALPSDKTAEATGPGGAHVFYSASATDLVDGATAVTCAPSSGSLFPLGDTAMSCSSTDAHGNAATGSFAVHIVDTTPPDVTAPSDQTIEATGPDGATATFSASASDLVDGTTAVNCSPASGSTFPIATTPVMCSSTDAHGNTGSASFNVTVQDTTPPTVTVPGDITTIATSDSGASVTYSVSGSDLVDGSTAVSCSPDSGSTFAIATTAVSCSSTDAHGNTGTGSFNVTVNATVPDAPTEIATVRGTGNSAIVSFTPPAFDGGNPITSYTATCDPGGISTTGTSSPITVTGLASGITYTCTATAANAVGASGSSSSSGTVTTTVAPGAPTITGVTGGTVSFTAPASNGGSLITGYTVTPAALTSIPAKKFPVDSGLSIPAGQTALVSATGTWSIGGPFGNYGPGGNTSATQGCGLVPSAFAGELVGSLDGGATWFAVGAGPTSVHGPGELLLATNDCPPSGNFGDNSGSVTLSVVVSGTVTTGSASPIAVTGLTANVAYSYTVTATNAAGTGPASTPFLVSPPNAPTITNVVAGDSQATISFTPGSDNGQPITSYDVVSSPGGILGPFSGSPITITGLTNGQSYTFSVFAHNAVGDGPQSASFGPVTPTGSTPSAPTITSATAGIGKVTVAFNAPSSSGGSPVTGYRAISTPGGVTVTGTSSPIVVTGLSAGTAYTFTLIATNASGDSPASLPSAPATPQGVPSAPSITSVTPGNAQVSVGFSPPASNGGLAIASYKVTSNPGNVIATGTTSPILVSGLTNGVAYTFTAIAINAAGNSPASAPSSPVTPAGLPGAPSVTNVAGGNAQVTVSFTAPASNGGSAITGYRVTSNPSGITANGASSPITVTGLTNGQSYTFTVQASNVNGFGSSSSPSASVIPATVPGAPSIISATAGDKQVTVTFAPPASNGGNAISSYSVIASPGGSTVTGAGSPITVSGLTNGQAYTFTVKATNSVGTSAASAPSTSVTPTGSAPPPTPKTILAVQSENVPFSGLVDVATGFLVFSDGSEIDSYTGQQRIAALPVPPNIIQLDESGGQYYVTVDPLTGAMTDYRKAETDPNDFQFTDANGNVVAAVDPNEIYFITTDLHLVPFADQSEELDPGSMSIVAVGQPYTLLPTPLEFQLSYNG